MSKVVCDVKSNSKFEVREIFIHNGRDKNNCPVCGRSLVPNKQDILNALSKKTTILVVSCRCKEKFEMG